MTEIAGKSATELIASELRAGVILRLMDELHTSDRNERPKILAEFFAATASFPERLNTLHSDLAAAMIKHDLEKSAAHPALPPETQA